MAISENVSFNYLKFVKIAVKIEVRKSSAKASSGSGVHYS